MAKKKTDKKIAAKKVAPKKKRAGVKVLTFAQAIALSNEVKGKRHLMLGNGFSIALFPKIFTYGTLFEQAKSSGKMSDDVVKVFDLLGTTDFEQVMEALQNAAKLIDVYTSKNPSVAEALQADAEQLQNILAETISENHPVRPYVIDEVQYAACRRFLQHFDGGLYTLNYDLLLYWTLMQSEVKPDVKSDDGFRDVEDGNEDYVVWDVQNSDKQRVYYLHGALHIFDAGSELKKYTWSKTDVALVDQIRSSLQKRHYPLFVTEGTSDQKLDRIQHSGFLNRAYRSFSGIGGSLFIYGHSLAKNDEHLLKLIDGGKTSHVFVGLHGNSNAPRNKLIIERAKLFSSRRPAYRPTLEVHFFDTASAEVWGS